MTRRKFIARQVVEEAKLSPDIFDALLQEGDEVNRDADGIEIALAYNSPRAWRAVWKALDDLDNPIKLYWKQHDKETSALADAMAWIRGDE